MLNVKQDTKDTKYWLDRCIKTAEWRLEFKQPYRVMGGSPKRSNGWDDLDEKNWRITLELLNQMNAHVVLLTTNQPFICRRWCNEHAKGKWQMDPAIPQR